MKNFGETLRNLKGGGNTQKPPSIRMKKKIQKSNKSQIKQPKLECPGVTTSTSCKCVQNGLCAARKQQSFFLQYGNSSALISSEKHTFPYRKACEIIH